MFIRTTELNVVEDNSKTLVDEVKDKVKDKGGVNMKIHKCSNGYYPRGSHDDDPQTGTPIVWCRVVIMSPINHLVSKEPRVTISSETRGDNCDKGTL